MKKYVIIDRERTPNGINVVNNSTKNLNEIFYSSMPQRIKESCLKGFEPKIFEDRSKAIIFKNEIQAQANRNWKENGHINKRFGYNKPKFKIEIYEENLFKNYFKIIKNE